MEIYDTNSKNALIQDLGPFRVQSTDQSIKEMMGLEYKIYSEPIILGSPIIYGGNSNYENIEAVPNKEKQNYHNLNFKRIDSNLSVQQI